MKDVTAETAKKNGQTNMVRKPSGENTAQNTALDRCYRQIGIPAVAAAVRYQGAAKNPAYAPVSVKWQDRADDAAA